MERSQSILLTLSIFLGVIVILPLVIDVFGNVGPILLGQDAFYEQGWLATVFAYGPILILLVIILNAMLEPLKNFGVRWKDMWIGRSILLGALSAAVIFSIDILSGTLSGFAVPETPTFLMALGFLAAWGVLAPLTEELLFRGLIQTVLARQIQSSWKVHPAVFLAAGFEMLMHLSVPVYFAPDAQALAAAGATLAQLIYVGAFGAIGGYVYQRTGSLAGPILIHAIGNIGELLLYWLIL